VLGYRAAAPTWHGDAAGPETLAPFNVRTRAHELRRPPGAFGGSCSPTRGRSVSATTDDQASSTASEGVSVGTRTRRAADLDWRNPAASGRCKISSTRGGA